MTMNDQSKFNDRSNSVLIKLSNFGNQRGMASPSLEAVWKALDGESKGETWNAPSNLRAGKGVGDTDFLASSNRVPPWNHDHHNPITP